MASFGRGVAGRAVLAVCALRVFGSRRSGRAVACAAVCSAAMLWRIGLPSGVSSRCATCTTLPDLAFTLPIGRRTRAARWGRVLGAVGERKHQGWRHQRSGSHRHAAVRRAVEETLRKIAVEAISRQVA